MAKCMLLDSELPNRFWGEAVCTAAYLQNRFPSRSISETPYELWHNMKPDLSRIRIFGSKEYSNIPKQLRRKWDDKAVVGVLVGFDNVTKGYRILNSTTNKTWVSRSVRIIEKPNQNSFNSQLMKDKESEGVTKTEINVNEILHRNNDEKLDYSEELNVYPETGNDLQMTEPDKCYIPINTLRRSNRTNKGIPEKRLTYMAEIREPYEPTSWEDMMGLSYNKREKWIAAAKEEIAIVVCDC